MADYRKLRVWERSVNLAVTVFPVADRIRKAGHADLSDQIKASVESIGSNIAEGSGHTSRREFARYLTYSIASSCELENQINLAAQIRAITWREKDPLDQEIEAVRKMLTCLRKKMDAC
jgi:four helix bundle protein